MPAQGARAVGYRVGGKGLAKQTAKAADETPVGECVRPRRRDHQRSPAESRMPNSGGRAGVHFVAQSRVAKLRCSDFDRENYMFPVTYNGNRAKACGT
jgi:hypothetical protein